MSCSETKATVATTLEHDGDIWPVDAGVTWLACVRRNDDDECHSSQLRFTFPLLSFSFCFVYIYRVRRKPGILRTIFFLYTDHWNCEPAIFFNPLSVYLSKFIPYKQQSSVQLSQLHKRKSLPNNDVSIITNNDTILNSRKLTPFVSNFGK